MGKFFLSGNCKNWMYFFDLRKCRKSQSPSPDVFMNLYSKIPTLYSWTLTQSNGLTFSSQLTPIYFIPNSNYIRQKWKIFNIWGAGVSIQKLRILEKKKIQTPPRLNFWLQPNKGNTGAHHPPPSPKMFFHHFIRQPIKWLKKCSA